MKTSVRAKRLRRPLCGNLWLSGRRLSQKSLILSLGSGRAEPFRTAGGAAAGEGSFHTDSKALVAEGVSSGTAKAG